MSILPLTYIPDPVLKQIAQPVENITPELVKQAEDMIETMYDARGIGLAANQVGALTRIFVIDIEQREEAATRNPHVLINPEIVWKSEEFSVMEEGCLSIPGQYGEVERPREVRIRFVDLKGQVQEMACEGLASHCVQHELDHLNGVLFIDYLSSLKRNMIVRKIKKLRTSGAL